MGLKGTKLGAFRAYFFGFFVCTAGFLFGYDTGIVGKCRNSALVLRWLVACG